MERREDMTVGRSLSSRTGKAASVDRASCRASGHGSVVEADRRVEVASFRKEGSGDGRFRTR